MKTTVKISPRCFYTDEGLKDISVNILSGKIALRNIPANLRMSDKRFYRYAFRHARGTKSKKRYDRLLNLLRCDLAYTQDIRQFYTLLTLLNDYEQTETVPIL